MFTATLAEIEESYKLAREVAVDAIGYPTCKEDVDAIENATPSQAIKYLRDMVVILMESKNATSK